jgi:hypothetical protein
MVVTAAIGDGLLTRGEPGPLRKLFGDVGGDSDVQLRSCSRRLAFATVASATAFLASRLQLGPLGIQLESSDGHSF